MKLKFISGLVQIDHLDLLRRLEGSKITTFNVLIYSILNLTSLTGSPEILHNIPYFKKIDKNEIFNSICI